MEITFANGFCFLLERKYLPARISSRESLLVKILNISRKMFITTTRSPTSFGPNFKNPFSLGKILAMLPYPRFSDSPDSLANPLHVYFSSVLNCRVSNYIGGVGGGVTQVIIIYKCVCVYGGGGVINWN